MSHYIGTIDISFDDLVTKVWLPYELEGTKSRFEWEIETPYGKAFIYDWKESCPHYEVTEWHIGGENTDTFIFINTFLIW